MKLKMQNIYVDSTDSYLCFAGTEHSVTFSTSFPTLVAFHLLRNCTLLFVTFMNCFYGSVPEYFVILG